MKPVLPLSPRRVCSVASQLDTRGDPQGMGADPWRAPECGRPPLRGIARQGRELRSGQTFPGNGQVAQPWELQLHTQAIPKSAVTMTTPRGSQGMARRAVGNRDLLCIPLPLPHAILRLSVTNQ